MVRPDKKELVKGFLAALAFIATGLFVIWVDGPRFLAWIMIPFGSLGLIAVVYRVLTPYNPPTTFGLGGGVVLRDGRDYRVDVTNDGFVLTHKASNDTQTMAWSDIEAVSIVAIDNWPVGGISFVAQRAAGGLIEVPWDAENSRDFLAAMAEKLPGFDNRAVIQASGMIQGVVHAWPPKVATVVG